MADDEHRNDQGAPGADPQWTFVNEPQQSHAIGKADEEPFGIYLDQEAMRHIDKAISSQSVRSGGASFWDVPSGAEDARSYWSPTSFGPPTPSKQRMRTPFYP